jgi:hypothetical protein
MGGRADDQDISFIEEETADPNEVVVDEPEKWYFRASLLDPNRENKIDPIGEK